MPQGLKVLVAGATGGVGKAVVQQLAAQVKCLSRCGALDLDTECGGL